MPRGWRSTSFTSRIVELRGPEIGLHLREHAILLKRSGAHVLALLGRIATDEGVPPALSIDPAVLYASHQVSNRKRFHLSVLIPMFFPSARSALVRRKNSRKYYWH